jgi:uncharacterized protein YbjT (DUF2867 family)
MYAITGATGNTGSVAAKGLLRQGAKVRVIGRSAERLNDLVAEGADPFVAELSDAAGMAKAFAGAKAAYVMIPPKMDEPDFRGYQERITEAIASAVQSAGVEYVVTLSSVGADKNDGTGPVLGLHDLEQELNAIEGLNALHLRAGYFMANTLAQAGIIQNTGMSLGPLRADLKLPMIATEDIGEAAASALLALDFQGAQTRELLGQRDVSYSEVAQIIGKAIGKPDLQYVHAPDDQVRPALLQMGMSPDMADLLLEMTGALNSGYMRALEPRSAQNTTPTSYESFVAEKFVPLYEGKYATHA